MTIVAWDGKMLAADKQSTDGSLKETVTKIHRVDNMLVGFARRLCISMEMLHWIKSGMNPEAFPSIQRTDDYSPLILINKTGVFALEQSPYPMPIEDRFVAIGSGRDFALAAMECGKSAREAVEIACKFDSLSGCGIDAMYLEPDNEFSVAQWPCGQQSLFTALTGG